MNLQLSKGDFLKSLHSYCMGGHKHLREVSCFAAEGMGVVAMSTQGESAHVDFDFFRIWESMKQWKNSHPESRFPKFAWMYHTHPPSMCHSSMTDDNAVRGWATSLGIPIQMVIVSNYGLMRYLCLKDNVLVKLGLYEGRKPEQFITMVMRGLSAIQVANEQDELDEITTEINKLVPVSEWDC